MFRKIIYARFQNNRYFQCELMRSLNKEELNYLFCIEQDFFKAFPLGEQDRVLGDHRTGNRGEVGGRGEERSYLSVGKSLEGRVARENLLCRRWPGDSRTVISSIHSEKSIYYRKFQAYTKVNRLV